MTKKINKNLSIDNLLEIININIDNYRFQNNAKDNILSGVATLKSACSSDVAFYHNSNYKDDLEKTNAGVVILSEKDAKFCSRPMILTDNPHLAFAKVLEFFSYKVNNEKSNIHKSVVIGENCQISEHIYIGPNVVIGDNVIIGSNCTINSNVTICSDTKIGNDCVFHSGCRIGTDGFGFAHSSTGWYKVPQIGKVIIGNNVDVGANTTIDCGTLEDTIIGNGVKIDNQVQIGHNCIIGDNTIIAGCTGIAGSTTIGKNCMIGGACNIGGHLCISDNIIISGGTTVVLSLKNIGVYSSRLEVCTLRENMRLIAKLKKLYEKT